MSREKQGTSLVTPGGLTPVTHLGLLNRVFPEIAPILWELREHWIQQFELQTAAELLLLDQALLGYAYAVKMGHQASTPTRRRAPDGEGDRVESAKAPAERADDPAEAVPAGGGGGKKAERQLRLLVRLNKMFLRNLNAMKRWRTQDIGTAVLDSLMHNLRR